LVNGILVHAASLSHFVTDFAAMTAEKTYRARAGLMTRLRGEDAQQTLVIIWWPLKGIILSLVSVVLAQRQFKLRQLRHPPARFIGRGFPREFVHQLINIS